MRGKIGTPDLSKVDSWFVAKALDFRFLLGGFPENREKIQGNFLCAAPTRITGELMPLIASS